MNYTSLELGFGEFLESILGFSDRAEDGSSFLGFAVGLILFPYETVLRPYVRVGVKTGSLRPTSSSLETQGITQLLHSKMGGNTMP